MKTNPLNVMLWALRIIAAIIMLQTLYFKFSGAEESIYIFTKLGMEPWGRIGTGVAELLAAILILLPNTVALGALMAVGIMAGAIISHFTILGIAVQNDGGQLFAYAAIVFIASSIVAYAYKQQLLQQFTIVKKIFAKN